MHTADLFHTDGAGGRPLSVIDGRDSDVLQIMLNFYARSNDRVLDVTANRRKMWTGVRWAGEVVFSDIDPAVAPDVEADFRKLPFPVASFDVLVFDPPHLPEAAASPRSDITVGNYIADYGLAHSAPGDNVSSLFAPFLAEASRVLRPDGVALCKLKDFVHNHRYQWTLADFIIAVRERPELTACDLIVKRDPCGGNLKSGRWQRAHHARNAHCWWVVVRKGKCESRRPDLQKQSEH